MYSKYSNSYFYSDISTQEYWVANGHALGLNEKESTRKTAFTIYFSPEGSFYAIQSKLSKLFLGVHSFTRMKFYSETIERHNRFVLHKENASTNEVTMIALGANWGSGGWVKGDSSITRSIHDKRGAVVLELRRIGCKATNHQSSHNSQQHHNRRPTESRQALRR
jgi:hypothetical protein